MVIHAGKLAKFTVLHDRRKPLALPQDVLSPADVITAVNAIGCGCWLVLSNINHVNGDCSDRKPNPPTFTLTRESCVDPNHHPNPISMGHEPQAEHADRERGR